MNEYSRTAFRTCIAWHSRWWRMPTMLPRMRCIRCSLKSGDEKTTIQVADDIRGNLLAATRNQCLHATLAAVAAADGR